MQPQIRPASPHTRVLDQDLDTALVRAIRRGVGKLESLQLEDGEWEGEVVWCPMLAAQYVLAAHIADLPISDKRRERIFLHFEDTQLPDGTWGLHEHSPPYLFVTALVYVACRVLGKDSDDRLIARARAFISEQEGGALSIPSWGKMWLSLMNLYGWEGVAPVQPEAWVIPEKVPLHPANYYCHTRLIYMGIASLYGRRFQAPRTPLTDALREELYPGREYSEIRWREQRLNLRDGDLFAAPTKTLRALYFACGAFEAARELPVVHTAAKALRDKMLVQLKERIRWELRTTDHTCISPVNGLLNILTLAIDDKSDPDLLRAVEQLEGWFWEDDDEGFRVTGARSATWDTSFVLQTLSAAAPHTDVAAPLARGASWLKTQQIKESFPGFREAYRVDPKGGFCFAGVWHGWPVSDCTAEAISGFIASEEQEKKRGELLDVESIVSGAEFLLQCQNHDGGFGSYEARKSRFSLEWLNPAEMFGDSMTELSYIECGASCLVSLAEARERCGHAMTSGLRARVDVAIAKARDWLLREQNEDGTWDGAWGIAYIYGTMFGVRGLRAAGLPQSHPAIQKSARWFERVQRADGGFGEHWEVCLDGEYRTAASHATQTAWALLGMCWSGANETKIAHAADTLAAMQEADGDWPKQEMVGVFFHTALLDYRLYRRYFPVWALSVARTRLQDSTDRERTER